MADPQNGAILKLPICAWSPTEGQKIAGYEEWEFTVNEHQQRSLRNLRTGEVQAYNTMADAEAAATATRKRTVIRAESDSGMDFDW